jgi:hypothetical protein
VIVKVYKIEKFVKQVVEKYYIQYTNSDDAIELTPLLMQTLSKKKAPLDKIPEILKIVSPEVTDGSYKKVGDLFWAFFVIFGVAMIITLIFATSLFITSSTEVLSTNKTYNSSLQDIKETNYGDKVTIQGDNLNIFVEEINTTSGRRFSSKTYSTYSSFALCQINGTKDTYIIRSKIKDLIQFYKDFPDQDDEDEAVSTDVKNAENPDNKEKSNDKFKKYCEATGYIKQTKKDADEKELLTAPTSGFMEEDQSTGKLEYKTLAGKPFDANPPKFFIDLEAKPVQNFDIIL